MLLIVALLIIRQGVWSRLGIAGQSTLNRTLVFWSWAFGARVCWLTASLKACVCTDGLRPGRNCYPAAAGRAGNRLELEARALILLPQAGAGIARIAPAGRAAFPFDLNTR